MNENMKIYFIIKTALICINGQTRLVARSWKFVEHLTNI